jgi:hypothetical protein
MDNKHWLYMSLYIQLTLETTFYYHYCSQTKYNCNEIINSIVFNTPHASCHGISLQQHWLWFLQQEDISTLTWQQTDIVATNNNSKINVARHIMSLSNTHDCKIMKVGHRISSVKNVENTKCLLVCEKCKNDNNVKKRREILTKTIM